jgi:hypothetical protein
MLHTFAVYFRRNEQLSPSRDQSFRRLIESIKASYACSLCRSHFQSLMADQPIQAEMAMARTGSDFMLFLWKSIL